MSKKIPWEPYDTNIKNITEIININYIDLLKSNKKILLIGAGRSALKNDKFGDIINTFDDVLRFNNYKIDGFEKFVGTKTTGWISRSNNVKQNLKMYNISKDYLDKNNIKIYNAEFDSKQKYRKIRWFYAYKFPILKNGKLINQPSNFRTGLRMIFLLLESGFKEVWIHGFDLENYDNIIKKHGSLHYFQNNIKHVGSHKPNWEIDIIMDLHKKGYVKFLKDLLL